MVLKIRDIKIINYRSNSYCRVEFENCKHCVYHYIGQKCITYRKVVESDLQVIMENNDDVINDLFNYYPLFKRYCKIKKIRNKI